MIEQSDKVSLSSILRPEDVFFVEEESEKEQIIRFLSAKIHKQVEKEFTAKYLLDRIFEVEKLNNVLETGFYIPHAKLAEIDNFHSALAILKKGFLDPNTNTTVKACFLLLTPNKPSFFQKHLNVLAKLSGLFQTDFINSLMAMKSGQEVMDAIKTSE
ncbi:MAG: PTS sugar transporter subunit IIA [Elusimicrobia bacterium]|nr:PTS sugar transporter subunit IIA [Elusimicrobiota bacterium]